MNIQCTRVNQVRYISQDTKENKYCNILLCWEQLVSVADVMIWGNCLRTVYVLWILYICVTWKTQFYQKADLCVATTFHPLTRTDVPRRTCCRVCSIISDTIAMHSFWAISSVLSSQTVHYCIIYFWQCCHLARHCRHQLGWIRKWSTRGQRMYSLESF